MHWSIALFALIATLASCSTSADRSEASDSSDPAGDGDAQVDGDDAPISDPNAPIDALTVGETVAFPALGIGTANNDPIGTTRDGNPCNDTIYLGGDYAPGYRAYRIASRLDTLVQRGDITLEEMQELQAETRSSFGETSRAPVVESLERTLSKGGLTSTQTAQLSDAHDRLQVWTLATPSGDGTTT